MLPFDDPRWAVMLGGYRVPYDPRPALRMLEDGGDAKAVWDELWNELHHQGDVDLASYAAVPHLLRIHITNDLADWNTYSLMEVIEWRRGTGDNPAVPDWLIEGYEQAWQDVVEAALLDLLRSSEENLNRCALGVVAMSRGLRRAGHLIVDLSEEEIAEWYPPE